MCKRFLFVFLFLALVNNVQAFDYYPTLSGAFFASGLADGSNQVLVRNLLFCDIPDANVSGLVQGENAFGYYLIYKFPSLGYDVYTFGSVVLARNSSGQYRFVSFWSHNYVGNRGNSNRDGLSHGEVVRLCKAVVNYADRYSIPVMPYVRIWSTLDTDNGGELDLDEWVGGRDFENDPSDDVVRQAGTDSNGDGIPDDEEIDLSDPASGSDPQQPVIVYPVNSYVPSGSVGDSGGDSGGGSGGDSGGDSGSDFGGDSGSGSGDSGSGSGVPSPSSEDLNFNTNVYVDPSTPGLSLRVPEDYGSQMYDPALRLEYSNDPAAPVIGVPVAKTLDSFRRSHFFAKFMELLEDKFNLSILERFDSLAPGELPEINIHFPDIRLGEFTVSTPDFSYSFSSLFTKYSSQIVLLRRFMIFVIWFFYFLAVFSYIRKV